MTFAFVPVFIKYLGIESYGLIGLFAVLQAWLVLLDMGMTPALGREMARFTAGGHTERFILDLLRSIEILALGGAFIIVLCIWLISDWLAKEWLRADHLSSDTVAYAINLMGIVSALRFVEGVYRSSIAGLQRHLLLNVINTVTSSLKSAGAVIIIIWIAPTIEAFFLWQCVVSLLALVLFAWATYRSLPKKNERGHFSLLALKSVAHFAGGMLGITFLSLLLLQVDKIVLSKLLNLTDYGHYMLAATVGGVLYLLINPIAQTWSPRLIEFYENHDHSGFNATFHLGAQLVSVIMGSMAAILIVFSDQILNLWMQDAELVRRTAKLVSILALGNLLNGLMWIPYQAQLAHGWTGLSIKINIISLLIILPAILLIAPIYGAEGAAWAWLCLNAGYVMIGVHFMYSKILQTEKWGWYKNDIIKPLGTSALVSFLFYSFVPVATSAPIMLAFLCVTAIVVTISAGCAAPEIRLKLIKQLKKWWISVQHEK